jgi:hypothetical protein
VPNSKMRRGDDSETRAAAAAVRVPDAKMPTQLTQSLRLHTSRNASQEPWNVVAGLPAGSTRCGMIVDARYGVRFRRSFTRKRARTGTTDHLETS